MIDLSNHLTNAVTRTSAEDKVALLLSGGLDSTSVGIALSKVGKDVRAYSYRLVGYESRDVAKAAAIAHHFGWPLTIVDVPTARVADDLIRLAVVHGCRKKVQFENLFPLMYVVPEIEEAEVYTAWNADNQYGNEGSIARRLNQMAREGATPAEVNEAFHEDRRRRLQENRDDPEAASSWWYARRLVEGAGKRLLDPYLDPAVEELFRSCSHRQLSPLNKPLIRHALANELKGLPKGTLSVGVRLQTGGGVDALFETVLNEPRINRFDRRYASVSSLCQRWGREVSADCARFRAEVEAMSAQPAAATVLAGPRSYQSYSMEEVRRRSGEAKFSAISMFSGGGGMCIGAMLAGAEILVANEFVPEARRTYAANFPSHKVDPRDIRSIHAEDDGVVKFLAHARVRPLELDVLTGGPPCAAYSTAGRGHSTSLRPTQTRASAGSEF